MLDREIAWRIFASEFNNTNIIHTVGGEQSPHYIITPTGARCNRLLAMGVITEVENIGHETELWRARIADPTGVFTIYAGQYQTFSSVFFTGIKIPSFLAVVGKARIYDPGDGRVYTSIRPEELNVVDEYSRDQWILETAKSTLKRIDAVRLALSSNLHERELIEYLQSNNIQKELAIGISIAITQYSELEQYLSELEQVVCDAVRTILVEKEDNVEAEPEQEEIVDPKEYVANIMEMLDTGKGAQYSDIVDAVRKVNITTKQLESIIKELMSEGRCYEPKIGMLRTVH
ncbi:MAG: DNA-binding protein [Methanosarcinales archaeon]|nr:MAG: DNA-binding protein [Methanosarcinales archaeon]